eukprot:3935604-Rhodomonas_salina.1
MQCTKGPPLGHSEWQYMRPIITGENIYLYLTTCFLKGRKKRQRQGEGTLVSAKMVRQLMKALGALRSSVEEKMVEELCQRVPEYQQHKEYMQWAHPCGIFIPK